MALVTTQQGICTYCSRVGEVTTDHIVPQCLWPGRVPKDSPQITACRQCNQVWKSEYDTYLRDMLVNDLACMNNPIAQKVREKYYRAVEHNRSIMARDLKERAGLVGLQEDSGIISGFALTLPDAIKRNQVIMPLIVRGLHLYYLKTALPKDTIFQVARIIEREKLQHLLRELNESGGGYQNIGTGDVFQFAFWSRPGYLYPQVWVFNFYRSIRYVVSIRANMPPKILLTSSRLFYIRDSRIITYPR